MRLQTPQLARALRLQHGKPSASVALLNTVRDFNLRMTAASYLRDQSPRTVIAEIRNWTTRLSNAAYLAGPFMKGDKPLIGGSNIDELRRFNRKIADASYLVDAGQRYRNTHVAGMTADRIREWTAKLESSIATIQS